MKLKIENTRCSSREATEEDILDYRNEKDLHKRLILAYEYQISKEDLYEEDYQKILDDMYRALAEL